MAAAEAREDGLNAGATEPRFGAGFLLVVGFAVAATGFFGGAGAAILCLVVAEIVAMVRVQNWLKSHKLLLS